MAKYLVGTYGIGVKVAILFDEIVTHSHVGKVFTEVTSGGFFEVTENNEIRTWGKSISCNVKCAEGDEDLIRRSLFRDF